MRGAVANYLIERALNEDRDVTPLHINKLVYFCHAWMLAIHHRPLLKEPVEAWPRGGRLCRMCTIVCGGLVANL